MVSSQTASFRLAWTCQSPYNTVSIMVVLTLVLLCVSTLSLSEASFINHNPLLYTQFSCKRGGSRQQSSLRIGNGPTRSRSGAATHCYRRQRTCLSEKKKIDVEANKMTEHILAINGVTFSEDNNKNSTRKRKRKARKQKPTKDAPLYWCDDTDAFVFKRHDNNETVNGSLSNNNCKSIRFTIRGKPVPLRRHRTSRGFMYNPSSGAQHRFRQVVQTMVWPETTTAINGDATTEPIFDQDIYLAISIVFRLKRPKNHFVGSKPGPGRLRPTAPQRLAPSRTDVDNLAKFVLDSLNGLLYSDDRQVVSLHATKVLDTVGECEGATEVCVRRLDEDDMDNLLQTSLNIVSM